MSLDGCFTKNPIVFFSIPLIFCFLFEITQGIVDGNDTSKIVSNIFCVFFAIYFFFLYIKNLVFLAKIDECIAFFIVIGVMGAWGGAIWNGYGINKDITALFRSLFIGWLAFSFSSSFTIDRSHLLKVIVSLWGMVSFCIALSWVFNFGLYTYVEYKLGHKFYFQSVNELTFVYVILWVWIYLLSTSFAKRLVCTLASIFVFMIIGNKAFIPLLAISFLFMLCNKIPRKERIIIFLIVVFCAVVLVVTQWGRVLFSYMFDSIIYILVNYSQGGKKLAEKLSLVGPFSALMSQRDMLWGYSVDLLLKNYNMWEVVFGRSFTGYGLTYGIYRDLKFSFAENDILDIFMSYGVVGVFILFFMLKGLWDFYVCSWAKNVNKITILLFVFAGFMTGHVMLFCFPVFVFSFLIGAVYDKSKQVD